MNTETQKTAECFLDQIHDGANFVSTGVVDADKSAVVSAMEKYAISFTISVLNDNISRLEAQREGLIQKRLDYQSMPIEFARLSGKEEGCGLAIENLRQEIDSLTKQMEEL